MEIILSTYLKILFLSVDLNVYEHYFRNTTFYILDVNKIIYTIQTLQYI